jgi:hypothetical protein
MSTVLHGRQGSLAALRRALEGAKSGRGQLALISGEAGIGKTAIATAIADEALAGGAPVTWGRAWEFADAPPYFPLWPCLRELGLEPGAGEPHDERRAFLLWEQVLGALAQRSSERTPRVLLIEDLHAADLATLDLLAFLAPQLRALPVLVVATMRSLDPRLTERMRQRLVAMARQGLSIPLEPLAAGDVARLAEAALGRTPTAPELQRLVEQTGGNPLFVVECARALRARGGGAGGAIGGLPETIRQVVLDRVSLLPGPTRAALSAAAVLGREFSAAVLARVDGELPARAIDRLLPAIRAGLVNEPAVGQFIFSHTLVRDAIEEALEPELRAELHGRAEAALSGDSSEVVLERARHALLALRRGDPERTLILVDRALRMLEGEHAFDRALLLRLRLEEARAAGFLPPATPTQALEAGSVAHAAGRSDLSRRWAQEAIAAARANGDPELLARAALLHGAELRPGHTDPLQVALLTEVRAALGAKHPALELRVRARLAAAMQPAADPGPPLALAREAFAGALASGDSALILDVGEIAGWAMTDIAPAEERVAAARTLLERAQSAHDLPRAALAHVRLAVDHIALADLSAYERHADELLLIADSLGHPRHRWRPLLIASARAIARGRFAESDRYVTEVAELASLIDDPSIGLSLALHELLRANTHQRDPERQRTRLAESEARMAGHWQADLIGAFTRMICWARIEDVEATRREIDHVGGARVPVGDLIFTAFLGEALALAGRDEERRRVREELAGSGRRELSTGQVPFTYEGPLVRVIGLLDHALGDRVRAEAELAEARALAVARDHQPWVAQTAYELGHILSRAGPARAGEARAAFEQAARIAGQLGMTRLSDAVARALGSSSGPAATPAAPPPATLTAVKEGELWRLESSGRAAVRVKDSRGMQFLAKLIERPGQEIHALALASDDAAASAPESSAGQLLDERAKKAYRRRLDALAEAQQTAEARGDGPGWAKLDAERSVLEGELARALGLRGRAREAGSATERARVNVQRRVKDALLRIAEVDAELGSFLERTVHTGTYCCFRP